MVFSSITFVCYFLPLVLLGYSICPKKGRNLLLWIASLFFYAWGEPVYVILLLLSSIIDYTCGQLMERYANKKTLWLLLSLSLNLSLLGFFKYIPLVNESLAWFGMKLPFAEIALPLGISFYTFQTLSYTIDVYRGKIKASHNFISFSMYVALFPQLVAGPIVRYQDIEEEIDHRVLSFSMCEQGILRFVQGLAKKVILANAMGALFEVLRAEELSMVGAWVALLAYAFQIYFDFSGYSDMAIGLGYVFGFHFPENFKYPYIATSIRDFWRRWHITLTTWFREYVYIPLGGNRKHHLRNLFIVWFLTGMWHGAAINFIIWGIYFAVLIVIEIRFAKYIERIPTGIRRMITFLLVLCGWVLFFSENVTQALNFFQALFMNDVILNNHVMYQLSSNYMLLIICAFACTPMPTYIKKYLPHVDIWQYAYTFLLFFICIAYLMDATYNPFLYFRF